MKKATLRIHNNTGIYNYALILESDKGNRGAWGAKYKTVKSARQAALQVAKKLGWRIEK